MRRRPLLAALALAAAACAPPRGGWDVHALEAREPQLRGRGGHRLGDASPYFAPTGGPELVLFLCRFEPEAGRPLAVAVDPDASAEERRLVRRALDALEGAGLGLRFAAAAPGAPAEIEVHFVSAEEDERLAGEAIADCALPAGGRADAAAERVDARLARAAVAVRRTQPDELGRPVPLAEDELFGTLLHELGHALGFQGHARVGGGAMLRGTEEVRRLGRRALAGEPLLDPTLAALYALPSGTVVGRAALRFDPSERIESVSAAAARAGLAGPFARVGDRAAMLVWRGAGAREPGLVAAPWPDLLAEPERLVLLPNAAALGLLESRP